MSAKKELPFEDDDKSGERVVLAGVTQSWGGLPLVSVPAIAALRRHGGWGARTA